MNWIEKMIAEQCPNGVDRVQISSFSKILRGKRLTKSQLSESNGFPVFHGGKEPIGFYSESNREADTVMVINVGASAGTVGYYDKEFWSSDGCFCLSHNKEVNNKYLYAVLLENEFSIKAKVRYAGIPTLDQSVIEKIEIPLPPLSIQEEIVSVLDKFSELIEKTDEEIALRQKQYEYYREKLLTFEKGEVEWKTINKIGQLVRGNGLQKADFREKGTGCIHYGQIYTKLGFSLNKTLSFVSDELANKLTKVEPGDLVIACTSENVEDVCKSVVWLGKETVVTGGHACVFKHNENPKYIGYCFLTHDFFQQKKQYAYGAKVIDIKTEKLGQIKLPIPSLSRQQEIVETLDKFETLISKLKEERELRQKQYEYYREKLLTF